LQRVRLQEPCHAFLADMRWKFDGPCLRLRMKTWLYLVIQALTLKRGKAAMFCRFSKVP